MNVSEELLKCLNTGKMHSRKPILILLILAALLAAGGSSLSAQSAFDPVYLEEAEQIREKLDLFTDRSMYMVNERIFFRVNHELSGLAENSRWSTLVYAELIAASGEVFVSSKHPLREGAACGSIHIPSGLLTGNYFLKCYTRWMRNQGAETYSYMPLRIINPFKTGVLMQADDEGLSPTHSMYRSNLVEIGLLPAGSGNTADMTLQMSIPGSGFHESIEGCVTVVPSGAIDTLKGQLEPEPASLGTQRFILDYLPDLNGSTLSGTVVDQDGAGLAFVGLHFTVLGAEPHYMVGISDQKGHFAVSAPQLTGRQEMIVVPDPVDNNRPEVRIDHDFDRETMALPGKAFTLSEQERVLVREMAIRMQLDRNFREVREDTAILVDANKEGIIPFYGLPYQRIEMNDFVNLPTLEEVFINLVPNVYVLKRKGKKSLKIESKNNSIAVYSPLIMMDYIPVFDLEALLTLNPEKLSGIDVINDVYVKGGVYFGGIISIHSREGDMAGIDLSAGAYFFDYLCMAPVETYQAVQPVQGDRIPDTRNTILWLDRVKVKRNEPFEYSFIAPTRVGEYTVLFRWVSPLGGAFSSTCRFRVE